MREMAAWVQGATPQLVELMLERMRVEAPAYFASEDPGFMGMARESIAANLEAVADGLASGRDQPAQLPAGAVEEALTAAQQRLPWTLIDRTYRIGHAVLWEQLLGEVESWQLDSSERVALLRVTSHFLFHYVDLVTGGLAEVHQAERDRQIRGRERRRSAWVREVLADVAGADAAGEYDLGREHLAAITWGSGARARDHRSRAAPRGHGAHRLGPRRNTVGMAGARPRSRPLGEACRADCHSRPTRSSPSGRPPPAPTGSGSATARRSRPRARSG